MDTTELNSLEAMASNPAYHFESEGTAYSNVEILGYMLTLASVDSKSQLSKQPVRLVIKDMIGSILTNQFSILCDNRVPVACITWASLSSTLYPLYPDCIETMSSVDYVSGDKHVLTSFSYPGLNGVKTLKYFADHCTRFSLLSSIQILDRSLSTV